MRIPRISEVCYSPDGEGGLATGKHLPDKDGFCNVCGVLMKEDTMMLYEKAKSEKWSRKKLIETIALLEDELSYEKSVANKFRRGFCGDDRTYKPDAELLENAWNFECVFVGGSNPPPQYRND